MWNEILGSVGAVASLGLFYVGSYKIGVYSAKRDLSNSVKELEKDKDRHQELLNKMYLLLEEMEGRGLES
jgi:hypothetical protein